MKNPFKITRHQDSNCIYWGWSIPFTKGSKWVEWSLYKNKVFDIELWELYPLEKRPQRIYGATDKRIIFWFGCRVPFRKETFNA